jgi:O-antigen/teichoic acid export membrane protein
LTRGTPTNPASKAAQLLTGPMLAQSTVWNLAGGIAPLVVAVVAIPIVLRGLGTSRFGILTLAWVFVGYFSLFDFGLGRAMTQVIAHEFAKTSGGQLRVIIWTGLMVMGAIGLLAGAICFAVVPNIMEHAFRIPASLRDETLVASEIMSFTVPVVILSTGFRGILEAQQKFRLSNLIRMPMGVMTYVAPLAVLPFTHNLAAVLAAIAGTRLIALVAYAFVSLRSNEALWRPVISATVLWRLLAVGGWISVSNFVAPFMIYADRFVIAAMVPIATVAYYTTPFEAIARLLVLPSAVSGVLFPAFATSFAYDPARAAVLFHRGSKYIFVALFPVLLGSAVFAKELLGVWINPHFAEQSAAVLSWLSVGILANSLAQVPYALVQGSGHPRWTATLALVELPAYVVLLVSLLGAWGITGAAFAWAIRTTLDYYLLGLMSFRLMGSKTVGWWRQLLGPTGVLFVGAASLAHGSTLERVLMFGPLIVAVVAASWFIGLSSTERAMGLAAIGIRPRRFRAASRP